MRVGAREGRGEATEEEALGEVSEEALEEAAIEGATPEEAEGLLNEIEVLPRSKRVRKWTLQSSPWEGEAMELPESTTSLCSFPARMPGTK